MIGARAFNNPICLLIDFMVMQWASKRISDCGHLHVKVVPSLILSVCLTSFVTISLIIDVRGGDGTHSHASGTSLGQVITSF